MLADLSTPSARRATKLVVKDEYTMTISIHALREEGDTKPHKHTPKIIYISIHALREEGDSKNRDKISIFL